MDNGYEPIIAINCTFRSLIPNFSCVTKESIQASPIWALANYCKLAYAICSCSLSGSTLTTLVLIPVVYSLFHPDPKVNRKGCYNRPGLKSDLLVKKEM